MIAVGQESLDRREIPANKLVSEVVRFDCLGIGFARYLDAECLDTQIKIERPDEFDAPARSDFHACMDEPNGRAAAQHQVDSVFSQIGARQRAADGCFNRLLLLIVHPSNDGSIRRRVGKDLVDLSIRVAQRTVGLSDGVAADHHGRRDEHDAKHQISIPHADLDSLRTSHETEGCMSLRGCVGHARH